VTDPASPPHRTRGRRGLIGILVGLGVILVAVVVSVMFGLSGPTTPHLDMPASGTGPLIAPPTITPSRSAVAPRTSTPGSGTPNLSTPAMSAAQADAAVAVLVTLPVKGRAPKTGYARAQFGDAWTDDVDVAGGHNGCDTRNDILGRDLTQTAFKPGTRGCVVLNGVLHDPYSAQTVSFSRTVDAAAVQIDHVVALSNAWQTGAQQLSAQQRQDLANDPANLQATTRAMNEQKGDGDAATWLPADKSYRCGYVASQITAKALYGLWVTPAERAAMITVLTGCGATAPNLGTTISSSGARSGPPTPTASSSASTTPVRPVVPGIGTTASTPAGDVYYAKCADAWAVGAAPLHRGQPGYRSGLDGDKDGVACESPPR